MNPAPDPLDILLAAERRRSDVPDEVYDALVAAVEERYGVTWPRKA